MSNYPEYDAKVKSEKAAKALESFVNPYGYDSHTFVEYITLRAHRTLQQAIGKLVFKLIQKWAEMYSEKQYDGRNEALCQDCYTIDRYMKTAKVGDWTHLPTV